MKARKMFAALLVLSMMSSVTSCDSSAKELKLRNDYPNAIWNSTPDKPKRLDIPEWCESHAKDFDPVELAYSDVSSVVGNSFNPMLSVLDSNTYYIYDDGTNRYALIEYSYSSYCCRITQLNSVKYSYENINCVDVLNVTIEPEVEEYREHGEMPWRSCSYMVIKLDQEIHGIRIDVNDVNSELDSWYDPDLYLDEYSGGITKFGEKFGCLGPDMEFVVQPEFDAMYKLRTDSEEVYYRAARYDEATGRNVAGILNENMEWVLEPDLGYNEFFYLDGSFRIACEYGEDGDTWLYTIDENGNKTGGKIQGHVYDIREAAAFCNRDHVAVIRQTKEGKSYWGVVNSDLEEIIPPIYSEIYPYDNSDCINDTDRYWVDCFACMNETGKYAIFLPDGTQYTQFIYDSAYDAYQALDDSMKGY